MNNFTTPPLADELEVSVIGPGYGEAIIIHVGNDRWFLIDSCKKSDSEQPASLEYLDSLGVDYSRAVELIIVSHWDQDHIDGIDSIVGACPEAEVVMSYALCTEEFLGLVDLHSKSPTDSGVEALGRVLELLELRKSQDVRFNSPEWAVADKVIFRQEIELGGLSIPIQFKALSPSNATLTQAQRALIEHIADPTKERRRVVAFDDANKASVVVWLEVGTHQVLLGGNLEESPHVNDGWKAIVSGSSQFEQRADLFKIPHHGSENAHNDDVWSELLTPEPFAVVTPWSLAGNFLPTLGDIRRILTFTSQAYLTAPPPKKSKFIDPAVRRTFREATESSGSFQGLWGHVRLRRPISDPSFPWSVDLFEGAHLLVVEN